MAVIVRLGGAGGGLLSGPVHAARQATEAWDRLTTWPGSESRLWLPLSALPCSDQFPMLASQGTVSLLGELSVEPRLLPPPALPHPTLKNTGRAGQSQPTHVPVAASYARQSSAA